MGRWNDFKIFESCARTRHRHKGQLHRTIFWQMFKTTIFTKPLHMWKSYSGRWVWAVLDQMVASTLVAFDFEWHFLIFVLLIWSYQYHRSGLNWISVLMKSTCICPIVSRTWQLNVWMRSIRLYKYKISASVWIIGLCVTYRNCVWWRCL